MIPTHQIERLERELEAMSLGGLKALQILPDNLLYKSLKEGLKINRYRTRRSMTRDIPLTVIRHMIQELIMDKAYDEMMASIIK